MFDFSVDKVEKSVKDSLQKLGLSYVDLIQVPKNISQFSLVTYHFSSFLQVHDIEFSASIEQIVRHTLPTLMRLKKENLFEGNVMKPFEINYMVLLKQDKIYLFIYLCPA